MDSESGVFGCAGMPGEAATRVSVPPVAVFRWKGMDKYSWETGWRAAVLQGA